MTKPIFTQIYDQTFRQTYLWVRAKSSKEFLEMLETKVPNIREITDEEDSEADGESLTLQIDGTTVICFWFNIKEPSTTVHELLHAVFQTMRSRNITLSEDSEETFCYLLSFLYGKILDELKPQRKKSIDKPKKSVIIKK